MQVINYTSIKNLKKSIHRSMLFILFFSFLFTTSPLDLLAQVSDSEVYIKLEPEHPKVGDIFTATLQSYTTDLDKDNVSWILDRKVIKSGFGEKSISLTMSKEYKNLLVKVTSSDGKLFTSGVSLLEKSVNIVWEGSDSYIPDWYKGKRYIARGGTMRAVAIANISDGKNYIDNKDLVFAWEVNGEVQDKISGLGRSYADIYIIDEYGDSVDITVTVRPRLTDDKISETITVSPVDSNILLYEKDSIYGIITKSLGGEVNVSKKDLELVAEPFYFSVDSLKLNNMKYVWSINGKEQSGNNYSRVFKLGDKAGYSIVSVYAEHAKKIMQDAKRDVKISF